MISSTPIKLSLLLKIENPKDYKIHFAVWNRKEEPLDVFIRSRDEWRSWNGSRGTRDDFTRKFIFSLIRFRSQENKWLFGGVFEITKRGTESNLVELSDLYQEYIGRLLIDYPGPRSRGRAFYFEKHFDKLIVSQVFPKPYSGEVFCGYEKVEHNFSYLESIFNQGYSDWKSALENVKGVYLIVDKSNGRMYVGSAYGSSGMWSRWACYLETGHGFNDELVKLIKIKGKDYARENFYFCILEYRAMKTDDTTIIEREQYWKRVLLSNKFGYNKN